MKKISIIFAVLAVFMLLASCSNAAGPVDNAGNPVDLAGSWSGTVAWKSAVKYDLPAAVVGTIDSGEVVSYTDYVGTWDKVEAVTKPKADYDEVTNNTSTSGGTTTTTKATTKYVFYTPTKTVTVSRVIAEDGSYVDTTVTKYEYAAKAAIDPVAGTTYKVYGMFNSIDNFTDTYERTYTYDDDVAGDINGAAWRIGVEEVSKIPAELAGVYTKTETTTVTFVKKDDYTFAKTSTTKTDYAYSGDRFDSTKNKGVDVPANKTVTDASKTVNASSMDFYPSSDYAQTKKSGKKPVEYLNDIAENITFEVAKDGTYTMKSVIVETQAAAAAAAATDTAYAAAERKASTLTTTRTTTGTVAAWENPATAYENASTEMALSAKSMKVEVVGTEDFLGSTEDLASVSALSAGTSFPIRIIKGEGKKDDTILTRLYIQALDDKIVILDKAPEAAE